MKQITLLSVFATLLFACILPAYGQNYTKITYVHSDADGTPFAATDEQGNIEWQIDHFPYGAEYSNTEVARKSDLSFAGKPYDEEIGLSYFGARWYDPAIGRFTGIDAAPVDPNDYRTFNRYAYGNNNPYKYVDPDGNLPILIPLAIFVAKEIAAEGASRATGGLTDFLSFRKLGQKALKRGALEFKNFRKVDGPNFGEIATKRRVEGGGSPALKNDPYHPDTVSARRADSQKIYGGFNPRSAAKNLGYNNRISPQKAPFNSHGQPVFSNGKGYITPDVDGHNVTNGWKKFDRKGRRTGTWNSDLSKRIKG